MCLQYFDNNFLLLNTESTLDPATDPMSTRGPTAGPADMFSVSDNLTTTLGLTARTLRSRPGHTPRADFGAFPTFLVYRHTILLPGGQDSPVLSEAVLQDSLRRYVKCGPLRMPPSGASAPGPARRSASGLPQPPRAGGPPQQEQLQ